MASPMFVKPIVVCGKSYYPVPFNADAALSITGLCVDLQQNQVQLTNMTKDNFQGETRKTIYGAILRRDGRMYSSKYNADGTARNGVHRENLVSLVEMDKCVVIPYAGRKLEKEYQLITREGNLVRLNATDERLFHGVIHKTDSILQANWWRVGNCLGACTQRSDSDCDLFIIVRKSDMDIINVREANEEKERQRRCREQAHIELERFLKCGHKVELRYFEYPEAEVNLQYWIEKYKDLKPKPEPKYFTFRAAINKPISYEESVVPFDNIKYAKGGYNLMTRNGMAVSGVEYTGKHDMPFRGADNMHCLHWDFNGHAEPGTVHPLDLLMVKV